jgi:ABC-2 type transport system ATP-binding protein
MPVLKIDNVVKRFHNKTAVNGASFEISKGSIFGLLGPNGAGKTTLIRIITSILKADEGEVYLNGDKLNDFHPTQIGYLPEERGLYKKMKVGEQLLYLAQLRGMSYSDAKASIIKWMTKFEMQDWWNKKIEELSKGMQQKVQFINTIVHNPKLIILDEPFTGLDPINTELIRDEILKLRDEGATIIFSTHRMEQVEEICEDIVLINDGKVVLDGKVNEIKEKFKENKYEVKFSGEIDDSLFDNLSTENQDGNSMIFKIKEGQTSIDLLRKLVKKDLDIKSFNEILPSLNDIFINIVKGV